jgi:xanthine dehydrogenase molybdenum-binding subunit
MIPFDFAYYRPDTLEEAAELWQRLSAAGKNPMYYGGGSEIITLSRVDEIHPGAVIDIKAIPECRMLGMEGNTLTIGAAVTLSAITESNLFPLLGAACGRVADHTNQCRISLGGNICGSFFYREAVLAFLAADSQVVIAGPGGIRTVPVIEAFKERLQLADGEFLVQVITDASVAGLPHRGVKRTRFSRINYPLVSFAFLVKEGRLRMAVSGLCPYPFRSTRMEGILNSEGGGADERMERLWQCIPADVLNDTEGSAEYRHFLFNHTIREALSVFKGEE